MSVPQGRNGYVTIGAVQYPFYSWQMLSPRNIIQGQPLGSTWATNWAEGLRTSRFIGRMMCRVLSTEMMALAFWNLFMTRTFSGGIDQVASSAIVAASGGATYTLAAAKAEAFVLTFASGSIVGLDVVFVAPAKPTKASQTPADYSKTATNDAPLMFDAVTPGGISNLYAGEIRYANNHIVDAPLNQTKNASGYDTGPISSSARFTVKEGVGSLPSDASTVTISLTSASGPTTRQISLTSVICTTPDDANVQGLGQVYLPFDFIVQGAVATPPVVIT